MQGRRSFQALASEGVRLAAPARLLPLSGGSLPLEPATKLGTSALCVRRSPIASSSHHHKRKGESMRGLRLAAFPGHSAAPVAAPPRRLFSGAAAPCCSSGERTLAQPRALPLDRLTGEPGVLPVLVKP